MKKHALLSLLLFCCYTLVAQTMYVRPLSGSQTSYSVANIKKLTFENGNLVVTNTTGANGIFALSDNRYLNFTNLPLGTTNSVVAENKFYVYPNPSNQWLNIAHTNSSITPSLVEIVSIEGKLLLQQQLSSSSQIDISQLPKGMYLCKINSNTQSQIIKFLKK